MRLPATVRLSAAPPQRRAAWNPTLQFKEEVADCIWLQIVVELASKSKHVVLMDDFI
jgi:hypothetical protein